jgi:hypothetical protein
MALSHKRRRVTGFVQGIVAGVAGTAAMTAHQEMRQRLARQPAQKEGNGGPGDGGHDPDPWQSAPAPALAGKRLIETVLARPISPEAIPVLTQVMHWSYGTVWGGVFGIGRESVRVPAGLLGPLFGLGVWVASYAELVPLGIYEPPWRYPLRSLAEEIGYHLTFGTTVSGTYELLRNARFR